MPLTLTLVKNMQNKLKYIQIKKQQKKKRKDLKD